jgi:hypothetical protein
MNDSKLKVGRGDVRRFRLKDRSRPDLYLCCSSDAALLCFYSFVCYLFVYLELVVSPLYLPSLFGHFTQCAIYGAIELSSVLSSICRGYVVQYMQLVFPWSRFQILNNV